MTTTMARGTSLENKHLRHCEFSAIVPLRLHSTMSEKYNKMKLVYSRCSIK